MKTSVFACTSAAFSATAPWGDLIDLVERLELLGHSFICSGSASGHRWAGPRMDTPEGFGADAFGDAGARAVHPADPHGEPPECPDLVREDRGWVTASQPLLKLPAPFHVD
jgi:hypothetical protein